MCVGWFRLQYPAVGKLLFAVPNGGARSRTEAAIMKAEGVTAGVTDLILLLGRGGLQRPMYRNENYRPTFRPIGRTNRMAFARNHERKQTRRLPNVRGIPVGNTLVHGTPGE